MTLLNGLRARRRAGFEPTRVGAPRATGPAGPTATDARATGAAAGNVARIGALRIRCGVQNSRALCVSEADTRWATPGPLAAAAVGASSARAQATAASTPLRAVPADDPPVKTCLDTAENVLSPSRGSSAADARLPSQAMADWKLTERRGPKVSRADFDRLDDAVIELRRRAMEVRAAGPLQARSMLRDFEPGDQVAARLEITGKGWLRAPTAGVDVRGDGTFVPFTGGMRREEIDTDGGDSAFDAVRKALKR